MLSVLSLHALGSDGTNEAVLHSGDVLSKLLFKLSDPAVTAQKANIISCVITSLLKAHCTPLDINRYTPKVSYKDNTLFFSVLE